MAKTKRRHKRIAKMPGLSDLLEAFARANEMLGKGGLGLSLVVTRHAKSLGLPLDPTKLITSGGGQIRGLGKGAVHKILREHGINQVLGSEVGRTNRGSLRQMRNYVEFLNGLCAQGPVDLDQVERWWIGRIRTYFATQPFRLKYDTAYSLRTMVRGLIDVVTKRQKERRGSTTVGTVLQHLVGAKLDLLLPEGVIEHHGASVADQADKRLGDFTVKDVVIHVTTAPSEELMRKCADNLSRGLRPVIVTLREGAAFAETLANQLGIGGRVDVFDAEQFLVGNFYEIGRFDPEARRVTVEKLVTRYNRIVLRCETDPSLCIEIG